MICPDLNIMQKKRITRISAIHPHPTMTNQSDQQRILLDEARQVQLQQQHQSPASIILNQRPAHHSLLGITKPTSTSASSPSSQLHNHQQQLGRRTHVSPTRPPAGGYANPTQNSMLRRSTSPTRKEATCPIILASASPPTSSSSASTTTDQIRHMKQRYHQRQNRDQLPYHLDPNNYDYDEEKRLEELHERRQQENDEYNERQEKNHASEFFEKRKQEIRNLLLATSSIHDDDDDFTILSNMSANSMNNNRHSNNNNVNNINNSNSVASPNPRTPFSTSKRGASLGSPRTGSIYNDYKYFDGNADPGRWHEREEVRAMLAHREEQIATDAGFRELSPTYSAATGRRRYTEFAKGVRLDFPKQSLERYIPDDPTDELLLGPALFPQWRQWKLCGGLLQVLKERKARMMEKTERDRALGMYHTANSAKDLMSLLINGNLSSARSQSIAATTMLQAKARSRRCSVHGHDERELPSPSHEGSGAGALGDSIDRDSSPSSPSSAAADEVEDEFDFCDEPWTLFDSEDLIASLKQHENEMLGRVGTKSLDRLKNMRKLIERERRMFVNSASNQDAALNTSRSSASAPNGDFLRSPSSSGAAVVVLSSALSRNCISDPSPLATGRSAASTARRTTTKIEPFHLSPPANLATYVARHNVHQVDVDDVLEKIKGTLSARNRQLHELQKEEYLRKIGREYNAMHYSGSSTPGSNSMIQSPRSARHE